VCSLTPRQLGRRRGSDLGCGFRIFHKRPTRAGQKGCDLAGRGEARGLLHRPFVDIGGNGFELDAGIDEQRLPRAALRAQDQRMFAAP